MNGWLNKAIKVFIARATLCRRLATKTLISSILSESAKSSDVVFDEETSAFARRVVASPIS